MKIVLYLISALLTLGGLTQIPKVLSAFGGAAGSGASEAQGFACGQAVGVLIMLFIAWKLFSKARSM
jgi:hypothetical protein